MLDLIEEALHAVARPVEVLAEADWVFAIGFWRNVRPGLAVRDHLAQRVGVVALVGQQQSAFGQISDHLGCAGDVGVLACGQLELDGAAFLIDKRVDLGREAASGTAQTTISTPLFAVAPCWWTRTIELSITRTVDGDFPGRRARSSADPSGQGNQNCRTRSANAA